MSDKQVKFAQFGNAEAIQESMSPESVGYRTDTLNASKDPLSGKTNKYMERPVEISAIDKGIWVKFSAAGTAATAGTNGEIFIPAGRSMRFPIISGYEYIRVIEEAASAVVAVTELY